MHWTKKALNEGLGNYKAEWDKLNSDLFDNNPFFDSRFVDNLLIFFGNGKEYLFIHVSEDNTIDGLVILAKLNHIKWQVFTASQAQIAPVLIKKSELLCSLFNYLGSISMQIDFLTQDPDYTFITKQDNKLYLFKKKHALTIGININENFQKYWSTRNKNLRKNIKRYFNRAYKEFSDVRLMIRNTKSDIKDALIKYSILETNGWKGKAGTAIQMGTSQGEFYNKVLSAFSEQNNANVYELYFNDELVASRLAIYNSQMLIILKTTYNEDYSSYAPGRLLLYKILEYEFKLLRVSSVELYTNASVDQLSWATNSRYIEHISIFRNKTSYLSYILLRKLRDLLRFSRVFGRQ